MIRTIKDVPQRRNIMQREIEDGKRNQKTAGNISRNEKGKNVQHPGLAKFRFFFSS
jgi:hypothetical protein